MPEKTATLIGATGLIGSHILDLLQVDPDYQTIRVIVRKPVPYQHPKVNVVTIDFADEAAFRSAIEGSDAVFVAVGTTQKKVQGDKVAYRKVDYDIPVNAARFCVETGCQKFSVVSSVGADSKSNNFYLKLKGEVEDKIHSLGLASVHIFRPSILIGKRNESRPAEAFAQNISLGLSFLFPSKYKPIPAKDVANAMIGSMKNGQPGFNIYHYREIMKLKKTHEHK